MLTQGDVTQTSLTIVEGSTFAELRARWRRIRHREAVHDLPDAELMAKLGAAGPRPRAGSSRTPTISRRARPTPRCSPARIG